MIATSTSNLHLNASYRRAVARAMERAADGIPACVCCLNPGSLLTGETYFVDDFNTDYEPVHVFLPEGFWADQEKIREDADAARYEEIYGD